MADGGIDRLVGRLAAALGHIADLAEEGNAGAQRIFALLAGADGGVAAKETMLDVARTALPDVDDDTVQLVVAKLTATIQFVDDVMVTVDDIA